MLSVYLNRRWSIGNFLVFAIAANLHHKNKTQNMKTIFQSISKTFIMIAASLMILSCSDDDSSIAPEQTDASAPFVTKIVATGSEPVLNRTLSMVYNSKKQMSQLIASGTAIKTYVFSYNDRGKIVTIAVNDGQTSGNITLTYDSNGRWSSYKKLDGTVVPITYDASSEVYTAETSFFSYNSFNDFVAVNGLLITYDNTKNGAFANVNGDYQFLALVIDPLLLYLGTKKPVTDLSLAPNQDYVITNTFYENSMIKNMKISIVEDPTTAFNADFTYDNK